MLPHGAKLAPAPETGDKEFDFMFAGKEERLDEYFGTSN